MRTLRTLQFLALLAVLALLSPMDSSKILKINEPRDGSVRSGDTLAFDLNKFFLFNVEKMENVSCSVT